MIYNLSASSALNYQFHSVFDSHNNTLDITYIDNYNKYPFESRKRQSGHCNNLSLNLRFVFSMFVEVLVEINAIKQIIN